MKMVKSLLLGTAAGLVAMTGAQAADLPVKAKPVQYVKICSLYGAGLYLHPGHRYLHQDRRLRSVRRWNFNAGNGGIRVRLLERSAGCRDNSTSTTTRRRQLPHARLLLVRRSSADGIRHAARATLASASSSRRRHDAASPACNVCLVDRAMIQFAGFTFGKTVSFFDVITSPTSTTQQHRVVSDDSARRALTVLAYTAQFGNGLSATLSARRSRPRRSRSTATSMRAPPAPSVRADVTLRRAGRTLQRQLRRHASLRRVPARRQLRGGNFPDLVANIRVDQAWGSAQIMGALITVAASYTTVPRPVH